jgi:hypothetical protein
MTSINEAVQQLILTIAVIEEYCDGTNYACLAIEIATL